MELACNAKGVAPGFKVRHQLAALTNAAGKGDLGVANQAATAALAIATKEGWPQMQTVVHMALGAAFLGAKKPAEALGCYRGAGQAAAAAVALGDPEGPKMLLSCRFAEGAALVSLGQFAQAAKVYKPPA